MNGLSGHSSGLTNIDNSGAECDHVFWKVSNHIDLMT